MQTPTKVPNQINQVPPMHICIQQKAGTNTYQIYLYDEIEEFGDFNWWKWKFEDSETGAKSIRDQLQEIPKSAEIEVFINSNGGSVKEGTAIFNQLRRHPAQKTGYVDGVAHSIAFVIFQACDHRVMGQGTSALIHEIWCATCGNADELRACADMLDSMMESNRKLFLQRATISEEELITLMKKETYLTPTQALEYGLCDEITGESKSGDQNLQPGTYQSLNDMKEKFKKTMDLSQEINEFVELCNQKEDANTSNKEDEKKQESEGHSMLGNFMRAFLPKEDEAC